MFPVYVTDSKITSVVFFHSSSFISQLESCSAFNTSMGRVFSNHVVAFSAIWTLNKVGAPLCSLQTNPPFAHNPGKRYNSQQFLQELFSLCLPLLGYLWIFFWIRLCDWFSFLLDHVRQLSCYNVCISAGHLNLSKTLIQMQELEFTFNFCFKITIWKRTLCQLIHKRLDSAV